MVTGINVFNVAGKRGGNVADEKCGEIADVLDILAFCQ